jgi:CheY-like chemotaxis protein
MLINDILDLSKIESGTVVVDVGELYLADLQNYVERTFRHVAESKGVEFLIDIDPQAAKTVLTDAKRLQQVIKNLLSNAFKFTHYGSVSLTVEPVTGGWNPENEDLNQAPAVLAFSVRDTGIGISPDKQQIIFEAFQQADGSTSRKYGGTGLGLAISRELSRLLGGEIRLASTLGKGSLFTLYLPQTYTPPRGGRKPAAGAAEASPVALAAKAAEADAAARAGDGNGTFAVKERLRADRLAATLPAPAEAGGPALEPPRLINEVGDDRDNLQPGEPLVLNVENDLTFAKLLLEAAREKGFKGLVTSLGAAALAMTREYNPSAISLDICLPDIDGWRVLERLKNDLYTRHIPVYVVSTEEARERSLNLGALGFVPKPIKTKEVLEEMLEDMQAFVGRPTKSLLAVEPQAARRDRLLAALDGCDVQVTTVAGGQEALQMLRERRIDCVVLNPHLPDMSVAAFAGEVSRDAVSQLPFIAYLDGEPAGEEEAGLKVLAQSFTLRQAHSPERLLDQAALFLHYPVAKLQPARREVLQRLYQTDKVLTSKKVLIVDDDIRNIFALSSVLEWRNMAVVSAETGRDAIAILQSQPDIDVVLMDIMMPEMDGFETMRAIRQLPQFRTLPIIAVTAKAMKGDRERCIEAGAWDYLSKPVDTEQMLSVLRAWLHR